MRTLTLAVVCAGMLLAALAEVAAAKDRCAPALDFTKRVLAGEQEVRLCDAYRDKVVLVVNTASKCGYTPQFDGLEALYREYRDRGLVVLGFPSNDFAQEYATEDRIRSFCRLTYSVEFPMFAKTSVARESAEPLYRFLGEAAGEYPRWNFHKYLLGRDGSLAGSYRSQVGPQDPRLRAEIERLLAERPS